MNDILYICIPCAEYMYRRMSYMLKKNPKNKNKKKKKKETKKRNPPKKQLNQLEFDNST
jgi:hypothetical protein